MADNFNLRSFLTENNLTKSAQLLNEFGGQDISTLGWEALEQNTDPEIAKLLADYKTSLSADYDACDKSPECRNNMGISPQYFNPSSDKTIAIQKELAKLATEKGVDVKQQAPPAKPAEAAKALGFWDKIKAKIGLKEENIDEASFSDSYDTPAAKAVNAKANQIVNTITGYKTALQTIQDAIKQVEQEVGSEATRSEKSTLERHLMHIFRSNAEMERESVGIDDEEQANDIEQAQHDMERRIDAQVENALQESRLTAKERRLVEMVKKALKEEENVDYTMGRHDDPDQLPNPPAELNIPEGEEMVQDKPLPKYESIEELMKEIEHGTNEAAHKYKMDEMKRVYEALEAKVGSLEEGEHAEHIDQKAVKQMRKDIAALRKAEEKLRKEFDKKFAGKEKKETPKAEKKPVSLAENKNTMENFDLKKFLAENKLTTNSRMLSENEEQVDELFGFGGPTEGDLVAIGYNDGSNEYGVVGPKGNQGFKVLYTGGKTDTQSSNSGVSKVGDPKGGTTTDGQREKTAPKVTSIQYANPKKAGFEGNPRSPKEVWDFYNKNWSKFK